MLVRLGSVCTKIGSGITPRGGSSVYKTEGVALIRSQNVLDFSFSSNGLVFVSDDIAEKMKSVEVVPGDVLLNITGDSVARSCLAPEDKLPARVNQHVMIIRADKTKLNPMYLLFVLQHRKDWLLSQSEVGATRKALTKSLVESLEIDLPDIEHQNKISSIFQNLQQLIHVNERINDYLSQIIDALVNHFNPLCSNSSLEEWCEYRMDDLVDCISGYAYSSTELVEESNTALTTIKNFDRAGGFKESGFKPIKISKEPKDGQFLDLFDIVVAHTDLTQAAEIIGNAELILTKGQFDKLVMSSDLVKLVSKRKEVNTFLLSALLKQKSFKDHALRYTSGTTVLHLSKKCIPEYCIILPTDLSQVGQICDELQSCYKLISKNLEMNNRLKSIREMLLSKMITP